MVRSRYHRCRGRSTTKCVKTRTLIFHPGNLWPRAKVGNGLACFQRAEIRGATSESFIHVGEHHTAIHGGGIRLEPEIEVLGLVYLLNILEVVSVELRHFHEDVVIDSDAVFVLMRRLAVVGKLCETSSLKCRLMPRTS